MMLGLRTATPPPSPQHEEGWGFREGDEIVPGRTALRFLGGGRLHEAYLSFDNGLHALVVAKILRPSAARDPQALANLAREAEG